MPKKEVFNKLREGLLAYDGKAVVEAAKGALDEGLDPLEAIDVLQTAIGEVGDKFGAGEAFLPELMMAADAMKAGTAVLTPAISKTGKAPKRVVTFVIGTVKGDIHDIGKTIVGTMLAAAGFNVIDIGIDQPHSKFAETAEQNKADIVGLSAIMATTIPLQRDAIDYFKALGIREKYKIMVGGGACTKEYAEEIGADGYGGDAIEAIKVAKELLSQD